MNKILKRLMLVVAIVCLLVSVATAANIPQASSPGVVDDWFIYVRNTSGSTILHGQCLIWDVAETTQQGWAVKLCNAANSNLVSGVVPDNASSLSPGSGGVADDVYFWMQIRGMNDNIIEDALTVFVQGQAVGTSADTITGKCRDGDGVGVAMETSTSGAASVYINIDNSGF